REQGFEPLSERGPRATFLVLEEHERVAPAGPDGADRLHPCPKPRVGVIDGAEAEIPPARSGEGGRGCVLVLDDGERGVARPQPPSPRRPWASGCGRTSH